MSELQREERFGRDAEDRYTHCRQFTEERQLGEISKRVRIAWDSYSGATRPMQCTVPNDREQWDKGI
jgi:hypothetical protein